MSAETRAKLLVSYLRTLRLPAANEASLQTVLFDGLKELGAKCWAEYRLSRTERIDFFLELGDGTGIGIEAKCRYPKRSIWRQLERYAEHEKIAALILVTGTPIGLPATIKGKPVFYVSLGRCAL